MGLSLTTVRLIDHMPYLDHVVIHIVFSSRLLFTAVQPRLIFGTRHIHRLGITSMTQLLWGITTMTPTTLLFAPIHRTWYEDEDVMPEANICKAVHETKPYYIPFRALTVDGADNMLVAGKTMSQTFHANGATRLHPSEWTTGVAAAGAAVMMVNSLRKQFRTFVHVPQVQDKIGTRELYSQVEKLQEWLNSSAIGQPLQWTHGAEPKPSIGYGCALDTCINVSQHVPRVH